jgi:hypothetical protein
MAGMSELPETDREEMPRWSRSAFTIGVCCIAGAVAIGITGMLLPLPSDPFADELSRRLVQSRGVAPVVSATLFVVGIVALVAGRSAKRS